MATWLQWPCDVGLIARHAGRALLPGPDPARPGLKAAGLRRRAGALPEGLATGAEITAMCQRASG